MKVQSESKAKSPETHGERPLRLRGLPAPTGATLRVGTTATDVGDPWRAFVHISGVLSLLALWVNDTSWQSYDKSYHFFFPCHALCATLSAFLSVTCDMLSSCLSCCYKEARFYKFMRVRRELRKNKDWKNSLCTALTGAEILQAPFCIQPRYSVHSK